MVIIQLESGRKPRGDVSETGCLRLDWYQRPDGRWNADCQCGSTLAGFLLDSRAGAEKDHMTDMEKERENRPHDHPACGRTKATKRRT